MCNLWTIQPRAILCKVDGQSFGGQPRLASMWSGWTGSFHVSSGVGFGGERSLATVAANTSCCLRVPLLRREGGTGRTGSSHPLGACSNRHGCRRASLNAGNALHLDVAGVTVVAMAVAVALDRLCVILLVLLAAAAVGRDWARGRDSRLGGNLDGLGLWWCGPSRDLPVDAGKGLELEATLGPLSTWLAGAVEGTQAGIDSTLIRLGTEPVCSRSGLEGTIVPRTMLELCKSVDGDWVVYSHPLPLLRTRLSANLARCVPIHSSSRPLDTLLLRALALARWAHHRWDGRATVGGRGRVRVGGVLWDRRGGGLERRRIRRGRVLGVLHGRVFLGVLRGWVEEGSQSIGRDLEDDEPRGCTRGLASILRRTCGLDGWCHCAGCITRSRRQYA